DQSVVDKRMAVVAAVVAAVLLLQHLDVVQRGFRMPPAELKKVTGDLGVTSGYVATNGKEIAALKRLGERNIIEINLSKAKQPQRVGDISLLLKKADPKRNRYTIEVVADDKTTEKKDRTIHEPVQFYV